MYLILILTILLLFVWAGIQTARLASYQKQARHMLQELQIASAARPGSYLPRPYLPETWHRSSPFGMTL